MEYQKTTWVNDETPLNADNLNKMEDGIAAAAAELNAKTKELKSKATIYVAGAEYSFSDKDTNAVNSDGLNAYRILLSETTEPISITNNLEAYCDLRIDYNGVHYGEFNFSGAETQTLFSNGTAGGELIIGLGYSSATDRAFDLTLNVGVRADVKEAYLLAKEALENGGSGGGGGADGVSPTVSVVDIVGGHRITITDVNGTKTFDVMDGEDGSAGKDGKDGSNGKDGVSATHSWNGTTLTITSASGTSSANLKGDKGDQGVQGPKGDTGEQGPQGIQGPAGADGAKGDKGDKGDTGLQGEKGETGATGPRGEDGCSPYIGSDGNWYAYNDEKGTFGNTRIAATGPQGEQGPQGIQGIQGEKGEKGDKGDPGATGPAYTLTDADKQTIVNAVLASQTTEEWTFTLEDETTVTKKVVVV